LASSLLAAGVVMMTVRVRAAPRPVTEADLTRPRVRSVTT
jgi:hypothetical protein